MTGVIDVFSGGTLQLQGGIAVAAVGTLYLAGTGLAASGPWTTFPAIPATITGPDLLYWIPLMAVPP